MIEHRIYRNCFNVPQCTSVFNYNDSLFSVPARQNIAAGRSLVNYPKILATIILHISIINFAVSCTIGVFSSVATQSHKPLLWKNRDVSNPDQAVYFFTDGRYRYLGLVYAGDSNRVWAGINEKGFAIINSNSYNIGSGISGGLTDGAIMKYALKNYASIEQFRNFLDSTNCTGRNTPANFAVMDSTGEATIFEASGSGYVRFNVSQESLGFMLRANFSLSGDTTQRTGYSRYLRGMELAQKGYQQGILDVPYIIQSITRDLGGPDFDPYPLPFNDTVGSYPFGFLPTLASINRNRTRAGIVIVGKGKNDSDKLYRMWTILGEPCVGIALPLFLNAEAVPEPVGGIGLPKICSLAKKMRENIYVGSDFGLNTFLLASLYDEFLPLETEIFNLTQERISSWQNYPPTPLEILNFEESLSQRIVKTYEYYANKEILTYPIDLPDIIALPNPARNSIKFVFNRKLTGTTARIYDISGKKVDELPITPGIKTLNWYPRGLGSGVYFLLAGLNQKIKVTIQLPKHKQ